ncbi:hypothetical protein Pmani_019445 [Petrolisthes manimaculis]|uniref:Uncharacterized protein n=1 Tax=Petrolisthes manimaculis TaxID=1843537 RepID=A0AAE1U7N4_9EUCA|nr:hypothetical protein Pmani_019445 [Petrolisthes manimaculis]
MLLPRPPATTAPADPEAVTHSGLRLSARLGKSEQNKWFQPRGPGLPYLVAGYMKSGMEKNKNPTYNVDTMYIKFYNALGLDDPLAGRGQSPMPQWATGRQAPPTTRARHHKP